VMMLSLSVRFRVQMTIAAAISLALCLPGLLTYRGGGPAHLPALEIRVNCPGLSRNGGRGLRSEDGNMLGSVNELCANRIIPVSATRGKATTTIKPVMSDYARRN